MPGKAFTPGVAFREHPFNISLTRLFESLFFPGFRGLGI
jgi:hypothetical protein